MADDLYYGDAGLSKRIYTATATLTAPVIYSTAAGTGGPLLWNGSTATIARVIGVSFAATVASAAAGALGLTGATGQTAAPSSTSAITATGCTYVGAPASKCTPYSAGTVTNAGTFFFPIFEIGTTALTALPDNGTFILLPRIFVVPPGGWISLAGSATLTTLQCVAGLMWEEIPV